MGSFPQKEMSICNTCKNCVGKCSWSREFIPVEGWKADKSYIKRWDGSHYESYDVHYCPQYEDYNEEGES